MKTHIEICWSLQLFYECVSTTFVRLLCEDCVNYFVRAHFLSLTDYVVVECVCLCVGEGTCIPHVGGREKLAGVSSHLLLCGFQGCNSDLQACITGL